MSELQRVLAALDAHGRCNGAGVHADAARVIRELSAEVERWRDPESEERQKLQEEIIFSLGDGSRSEVELREGQLDMTEAALALARAEVERLKQELAEARSSDAESLAMYHRARDRADALQAELAEAREKAKALDELEAWLRCPARSEAVLGHSVAGWSCDLWRAAEFRHVVDRAPTLSAAIRAAIEKARQA